jgi:hypothetical protein
LRKGVSGTFGCGLKPNFPPNFLKFQVFPLACSSTSSSEGNFLSLGLHFHEERVGFVWQFSPMMDTIGII